MYNDLPFSANHSTNSRLSKGFLFKNQNFPLFSYALKGCEKIPTLYKTTVPSNWLHLSKIFSKLISATAGYDLIICETGIKKGSAWWRTPSIFSTLPLVVPIAGWSASGC